MIILYFLMVYWGGVISGIVLMLIIDWVMATGSKKEMETKTDLLRKRLELKHHKADSSMSSKKENL